MSVYIKGSPPEGTINRLHDLLKAVAPCHGAGPSIERWNDRSTWRCVMDGEATAEQIAAAEAVMDAFDPWALLEQEDLVQNDMQGSLGEEQSADDEAGSDEGVHAVSPEQDATLTPDAGDLQGIRDAYEASHDIPDYLTGIDDVDAVVSADHSVGNVSGEPVEAGEDADGGGDPDFSAEPMGDDSALGEPNSYPGMMMVGDALATAKAMALMTVDDERFARVGDYDKAENQAKLDELRAIQQAIREGVHPPFTDEQASELQALETFLPFTQRIDDHAQGLRNAIREAEDLEQLTAIDILSGWPE